MNLGVYKNFIVEDEEEGLLDILKNFESGQDIDDLKIKSANAKTVVYIVSSDKRFESQTALNQPVGIGEHSDVMGTIDGEINSIAQAHEKIEIINHYFLNR